MYEIHVSSFLRNTTVEAGAVIFTLNIRDECQMRPLIFGFPSYTPLAYFFFLSSPLNLRVQMQLMSIMMFYVYDFIALHREVKRLLVLLQDPLVRLSKPF